MTITQHQRAAASRAAKPLQRRGVCPACQSPSLKRVTEPLVAPLHPVGMCRLHCVKCNYSAVVITQEWEAGS